MSNNENNVTVLDIEALKLPNVGFKFLASRGVDDSSAVLLLQWCIAPQLIEVLKRRKEEGKSAYVFVVVKDSHDEEKRYVFNISSPQELIEFHCSGQHKISGYVVVRNRSLKDVSHDFLKRHNRHLYDREAARVIDDLHTSILGEAEMSVDVADGFFTPEMSAWQEWWVNLWFGEPAWDECGLRKRKWIAYTVQLVAVGVWASFLALVRLLYAFWAGVLFLRKDVPWEAIVRPFVYDTNDIWLQSSRRWKQGSYKNYLTPVVAIPIAVVAVGFALFLLLPLIFFSVDNPIVGAFFGLIAVSIVLVRKHFPGATSKKLESWESTFHHWGSQEVFKKSQVDERMYSDLSCTMAPIDGSARARRRGLTPNVILAYHRLKVRVCRPIARRG